MVLMDSENHSGARFDDGFQRVELQKYRPPVNQQQWKVKAAKEEEPTPTIGKEPQLEEEEVGIHLNSTCELDGKKKHAGRMAQLV
jgi:hypothetical protein